MKGGRTGRTVGGRSPAAWQRHERRRAEFAERQEVERRQAASRIEANERMSDAQKRRALEDLEDGPPGAPAAA